MGHHVDHGAGRGQTAADEDAQHHEAEVADGGVGDEAVEVVLADGGQAAVDDADRGRHRDRRGGPAGGLGEQRQDQGDHAVGADLVQDADEQHGCARGGLLGRVRQPGVQRDHGGLDGEGDEEGGEDPPARRGRDLQVPREALDEEGVLPTRPVDEQGDDADEHDQSAGQRVQQELEGGAPAPGPAEAPDEEVHRDEHGLEAQVEEEDVAGGEDDDDEGLQDQDQPGEPVLAVGRNLPPGGEQHNGGEEGGQQEHGQAQPVDAQGPGHAQGRDPGPGLGQLEAGAGRRVEAAGGPHPRAEHGQAGQQAEGAGAAAQRRHEGQEEGPREGQDRHDGEHGEGCGDGVHMAGPLRTWWPGRRRGRARRRRACRTRRSARSRTR